MSDLLLVRDEGRLVAGVVLFDTSQLVVESVRQVDQTHAAVDVELQKLQAP